MENKDFNKAFNYNLHIEFQKIDKFLKKFRTEFITELSFEIEKSVTGLSVNDIVYEMLLVYANQTFNTAESVIDKDKSYTASRLQEELEAMNRLIEKDSGKHDNSSLAKQTHFKAKEIMVKFYPNLINLSANGFRLLEKYCLMYNREFMLSLENQDKAVKQVD
jgi:hypothetical protein